MLLAVDNLQDVVELRDECPKRACSNDEKQDTIYLEATNRCRAQVYFQRNRESSETAKNTPNLTHPLCFVVGVNVSCKL